MMKKGVVIVSVASIGVLIIAGGVFVAMSLFGRFAGIEQEKLVSYRYRLRIGRASCRERV